MPKRDPSDNAVKHGCCSKKIRFLKNEDPAEYDRTWVRWGERYNPADDAEFEMVRQLVDANWGMQRSARVFEEYEFELLNNHPDPATWTREQHNQLASLQRYATTATNKFNKALRLIEFMQKSEAQRFRRNEATVQAAFQDAALPPEHKEFKDQLREQVETPVSLPAKRNDGGCICYPCLTLWGIDQLRKRPSCDKQPPQEKRRE